MSEPVITLQAPAGPDLAFTRAEVLPGRGMTTLQVRARVPGLGEVDVIASPPLEEARARFDRGSRGPFPGNESYLFGGAVLIPYANRIRGLLSQDGRTIRARIPGGEVALPANAGGRPGAEQYSMHGLVLDAKVGEIERRTTSEEDAVSGTLHAGDFGGRWLSKAEISFENILRGNSFTVRITVRNAGREILPMGIGWHPYFNVPSLRREQARLYVPARRRTLVNDYDETLPTGEVVSVAGTPYDFSMPGGRAMGDLFLDDCFVDLEAPAGEVTAEVADPASGYGLRVVAAAPPVRAIQVYAPPDKPFIVVEPQSNWADPFGEQWGPDVDTGMARLAPGESVTYQARLELFRPPRTSP